MSKWRHEPHFQVRLCHSLAGWVTSASLLCRLARLRGSGRIRRALRDRLPWLLRYQACTNMRGSKAWVDIQGNGEGERKDVRFEPAFQSGLGPNLRSETVIVSVELAHGQSASGFSPLPSNALRNASHADRDPGNECNISTRKTGSEQRERAFSRWCRPNFREQELIWGFSTTISSTDETWGALLCIFWYCYWV